ncbi:30S ribosomal protein S6 [Mycoplasma bradburyae]|uniref:Small ribosomal subunit protein bS6 n=1 Tax=Mycoplasma bradburyae TaxID=2963128 RepID=A0AAW6HRI8_9MOLU|nr:30S ribosomal protein S6 [Mycoplasma bradburyae]MDC4162980.1 30S ribosomal protein S6 [Mycoplasma bradburyae]MDC4181591.1 30S ribosomal protein S6 [Mycoplasma bradburyae]MDC4182317.1 30S ribosomal protein S6 [Mycoplasma bradburyae]MDC4183044.1 30S ribosomal protein S6 [Mycoplasma bradburyae]MDC4183762.1 30S ribosomal protein S6 [Mycoplasma bradburyae]
MAKYEIMLLVSGKLNQTQAQAVNNELKSVFGDIEIKEEYLGQKTLEYPINKEVTAHYYNLFLNSDAQKVHEYKRVSSIRTDVLRTLIINTEKDFGYRATQNEKKVAIAKQKQARYEEIMKQVQENGFFQIKGSKRNSKVEKASAKETWILREKFGEDLPEQKIPVLRKVNLTKKTTAKTTENKSKAEK